MRISPAHYVLTGGPCSGKTTLVNEFKDRGYSVLPESARTVIAAQLALGKTIETITADSLTLERMIISHQKELESSAPKEEVVFLDRGNVDNVAYCRKFGVEMDEEMRGAIEAAKYRKIFLLDMIEFVSDAERYETLEEAEWLHRELRRVYEERGFEIIEVPLLPVSERADFVLSRL